LIKLFAYGVCIRGAICCIKGVELGL
jgi:hypothetical protein